MELAFVVYMISIVESVSTFIGFVCAFFLVVGGILSFVKGLETVPYSWKLPITLVCFGFIFGGIKAILPTERQGYIIAGAYVTQKIAENDNVQEIGGKLLQLINQKLDAALADKDEKKND